MSIEETSLITQVEQQKKRKNRYNIYVNDEYLFSVHEDVLIKHRIFKGEEIDEKKLIQITKDEEQQQAFLQAIRYISRKPRAQKEIEKKLIDKQYDPAIIEIIIQKLLDQKYIDDQDYGKRLAEYRVLSQKKGIQWVKQELYQKGLSKEHIEDAVNQIDEDTEYNLAYELLLKRWNKLKGSYLDKKRKMGAYLLRRGYSHTIVNRALRQINSDDYDEEEEFQEE